MTFTNAASLKVGDIISSYKELSKSGIVTLVLISVLGGYFIGHPFELSLNWREFFLSFSGVLFLASSSSALNQWQERLEDSTMNRTKNRPIPSGRLSSAGALVFILVCLSLGLGLLSQLSWEVFSLGCLAVVSYNGFYTLWWKRKWAYAAVPGAIPGAIPVWIGYTASSHHVLAPGGLYLFALLFFWQMPHFWVLALKYREDYARGGFPTLPVARGEEATLMQIAVWGLAYIALSLMAPLFLHVGLTYFAISLPMSLVVFRELQRFIKVPDSKSWLRFFLWVNFSLIIYIFAIVADLWGIYLYQLWATR